jgi:hypothetical protein
MSLRRALLSGLVFLSLHGLTQRDAAAQVMCSTLKNPLTLVGSTALEPLYKGIGPKLATDAQSPLTLLYLRNGSCAGAGQLGKRLSTMTAPKLFYVDASYTGGDVPQCENDIANGIPVDIAVSDVFYESCNLATPFPTGYKDFLGPVGTMLMVVPKQSTQTVITAEEAYYLFGFGASGDAAPWGDETMMCIRSASSGTQGLWAAAFGVPASSWRGKGNAGSMDVLNCLAGAARTAPEKGIGILGAEIYDAGTVRNTYKALAFRSYKQQLAYYPDSTATALDKQNVRNGRYTAFGYAHLMTQVDGQGKPTNPSADQFVSLLVSQRQDVVTTIVRNVKMVPQCAMNVTRSTDGGELSASSGPACGCFYDTVILGRAPDRCQSCKVDGDCATAHCRLGFCEPR